MKSLLLLDFISFFCIFRLFIAVKNLFDIKVLTCARGKFDDYLSLILESNTCDDLNEDNGELCQCQGLKYDG